MNRHRVSLPVPLLAALLAALLGLAVTAASATAEAMAARNEAARLVGLVSPCSTDSECELYDSLRTLAEGGAR